MATALTRDGRSWVPAYLDSIDAAACIGCGRCYKVCARGVMEPIQASWDDDEDDEEVTSTVMSVADPGACIGCEACSKVCAKKAHTHVAA
ncbi:MAG: ferredoxin III, nif-specific [Coriobacteriia bacterium]